MGTPNTRLLSTNEKREIKKTRTVEMKVLDIEPDSRMDDESEMQVEIPKEYGDNKLNEE